MMDWFRHYHGLCTDPKLHRIARAAKVSRGLVIAAWCAILETASQNDPRGSAEDVDETSLAFMIDVKPGVAARILEAVRTAGLIDGDGYVAAWGKRQRASDDVATRVAKHREQKSVNEVRGKKRFQHDRDIDSNPLTENETSSTCNVTKSARTEQNRTEQNISPSEIPALADGEVRPLSPKARWPTRSKLPKTSGRIEYPPEFEEAFSAYPIRDEDRTAKGDCYTHWQRAVVQDRVAPEVIVEGAQAWAFVWARHEYRIGFRKWLREALWNHSPPKPNGNGHAATHQKSAAELGSDMFRATLDEWEARSGRH